MKQVFVLLLFLTSFLTSNAQLKAKLASKTTCNADVFVGVDQFKNNYFVRKNLFFKNDGQVNFSNYLLGNPTSVDISNPYKIVLFYKNFNTVIILDNNLNQIDKIAFPYNIAFARKAPADKLWILNRDLNQLEIYNYKSKIIESKSPTLNYASYLDMKSDNNSLYLATEKGIAIYDYLGNFLQNKSSTNVDLLEVHNQKILFQKKNNLYILDKTLENIEFETSPSIKSFYFLNNDLYIFDGTQVAHYLIDKND